MFKLINTLFVAVFLFTLGCSGTPTKVVNDTPTHTTIHAGDRSNVINLECGKPCALVRSADDTSFVAIFSDGSTITFTFDE